VRHGGDGRQKIVRPEGVFFDKNFGHFFSIEKVTKDKKQTRMIDFQDSLTK